VPDFLAELRAGSATLHRLTVAAAEFRAVLATPHLEVLGWVSDYLADSWPTSPGTTGEIEVYARIDELEYERLLRWTERVGDPTTTYLLRPGHAATTVDTLFTSCRDHRAIYARTDSGVLGVLCPDARSARFAALRVLRDALTAKLEEAGWVQFHGAGVERDGRTALVLGDKGAGKTACALGLVASGRSRLLANDRVMIRDEPTGTALLPWPTPVNVGLGLLSAMSWLPDLHRRYRSGVEQPPNQPAEVTAALRSGRSDPMYDDVGRELKCEIMPDQLRDWFRVGGATRGTLELVLFPRVDLSLDRAGAPEPTANRAGPRDLMPPPGQPDIFPDFLGLRPVEVVRGRRRRVERALAAVSRARAVTIRLGREFGVPDVL
jgi:hypothetical protein